MSSNTRPPEPAHAPDTTQGPRLRHATLLRIALVLAYPVLAHLASGRHDGRFAVLALADIALVLLLRPLLERRGAGWLALLGIVIALAGLFRTGHALVPLLLVPVAIIGLVAYAFARTLRTVPLITRMVAGLDGIPASALSPELIRYTRNLTRSWAVLLALLALANLLLSLLAVPDGLLASYGVASPWPVDSVRASWCAGVFNIVLMVGFFLVEFAIRQRRFPGRYHNLVDFLRRMARLGPEFWRDVAH
jgi:uncharacterized membrane protein